ncbi:tRNA uridine-5-carboxymethylaminomethyl(34) synthesis GTPase MnmE [Mycoplasmopsis agassizii]|uniref:tRNA modification GTPase MnmE n=1 Tax=Mycoplasmopsis agassizii TaxID=33922 RepID=A0ABX4H4Q7_9BACT|nr:tRNA uridine-5-carboxymethylaminomethyl(34) synthesis GTPase MnmE [Mycoplasmopsis agassizii]PAF54848.1 tRNA uridine-5-carboxymethylaminomethyl(34) synthesis GTPase MnmE [Mycoplasmopsis agassizii]SMC18597.1 tRNA modification GTPase [Mycoplasmopsis agassizii]
MFDTICAISSGGVVNQPIGIIRISGPDTFTIIKKIFKGKFENKRGIYYGHIHDKNEIIDEVVLITFENPNSYTGEDLVEINAHGGLIVLQKIIELIFTNGARAAEPGEFTRRAFLNGKIDLIKADAIHELIFSKTETQAKASVKKFSGQTSKFIQELISDLQMLIGHLEVNIDYPEYDDIEILDEEKLINKVLKILDKEKKAIELSEKASVIFEGIKVAIVGKPNSGKSSLLNLLLNEEKAIVTNIPGTTRDIINGEFQYQGILFQINDSAGIRNHSSDVVENIGIERSLKLINESKIIIHLIDAIEGETEVDKLITEQSKDKKYIKVFSKSDLLEKLDAEKIYISSKEKNIDNLLDLMVSEYKNLDLDNEKVLIGARQMSLLKSSYEALNDAYNALSNGLTADIVITDITKAWEDLINISGKADNELLLDEIFKNFCLGK